MVDPLTTFAAAGNALQFVQLGIDLILKTIDYSNGGGNRNFQNLQDCVQHLSVSGAHLQQSMQSHASQPLPPGPARALHRANLECLKVSQDFTAVLDKLGLNRPHSLWSSVKLALKTHVDKPKIDALSRKLDHARANLMLSLMVYLHDQSAVDRQNMSEEMRVIAEQTMKATARSSDIKDDIARLSSTLSSLIIDDSMMARDVENALKRCDIYLSNEINRLSSCLEQLNDGLKVASDKVHLLLPTMSHEIATRRMIVARLGFSQINNRRNRISRAHSNTYQWIFRPKDSQMVVWDDFIEWLHSSRHPIYWVSGKPGSGKSTLMRELEERANSLKAPSESGDDADFLIASFYFWYAGTNDEKSMSGLLRTLIYQLLSPRLDIVDQVVEGSRWEESQNESSPFRMWEEKELNQILFRVLHRLGSGKRILLFVDGLDEQDGPDDQRQAALNLLHTVTRDGSVKACVASRPYNIFRDEFKECPKLQLEDLTKDDIRLYTRDKLGENRHLQRQLGREPQLLHNVTEEITTRARGVFLWVRLVVRDLLRVLRDGGGKRHLFRELERIPLDLDEYFRRILESVETPYRKEASIILQTAMYSRNWNAKDRLRGPDFQFLLVHLAFIDLCDDQGFGASAHLPDANFARPPEAQDFLESLERMLMSRCMGLLEIESNPQGCRCGYSPAKLHPGTRIEFLHRTVRDYFAGAAGRDLLHQHTGGPFDAHMFRCNLMVMDIRTFVLQGRTLCTELPAVGSFLAEIVERPEGEQPAFALFEKVVELFNEHTSTLLEEIMHPNVMSANVTEVLRYWLELGSNAMSLSIQLGWKSYIRARLTPSTIREKAGKPLLHYALIPYTWVWKLADRDILCELLSLGADPNSVVDGKYDVPIWAWFLESLRFIDGLDYAACLEIVKLLVLHGIQTGVTETELVYVYGLFLDYEHAKGRKRHHSSVGRRLNMIRTTMSKDKDGADSFYSFLDVVQSLTQDSEQSEAPLFAQADIVALRELEISRKPEAPCLKGPALGEKRARESSPMQMNGVRLESNGPGPGDDGEQPLHKRTRRSEFLAVVLN